MKKVLITGGTTFVSRYAAEYFCSKGYQVFVLNRNSKAQFNGVTLIEGDRHNLRDKLRNISFDAVLDITAYKAVDVLDLLDALDSFGSYVLISSSAVYPEDTPQPFNENSKLGENKFWKKYGTDKIEAEEALLSKVPDAYILRPPYLYGPMNNVYREAFVFDCAKQNRLFYLPKDGKMKLQFFHVKDLCKIIEKIIETKPADHILNVGNEKSISIKEWVTECYACLGKEPVFVNVFKEIEQRLFFSFYDYEYSMNVQKQKALLPETIPLKEGLKEAFEWYVQNEKDVNKKPMIDFIDKELAEGSK